jgi:hypothetical protein
MRPVTPVSTQEYRHPLGVRWWYVLSVPSAGVPLTDTLVIDVSFAKWHLSNPFLTANLDRRLRRLGPSHCE